MFRERSKIKDSNTPLIFTDGSKVYEKFAKEYTVHDQGLFILAPSGAGKTHFIKNQDDKNWIDGDILWEMTGAHPDSQWWTQGEDVIREVDQRSDLITYEATKLGFWIMGASNFWLKPDAIVIPDWKDHKKYIEHREKNNYDGGVTSKDHEQVLAHRERILEYKNRGVPKFESIKKAVEYLLKSINSF